MSLKQEIETWVTALAHYDKNEFDESLAAFDAISDTSKILFNIGVIHATLGEHEKAVEAYLRAVKLDKYLAVAYFQQGVSNFLMGDFEEALANFNDALHYLRGNNNIDYEQLGLKFKLFACEVLFNRGLCYIYLRQADQGMQDLTYASKEKVVPDHEVIDEAIRERADGYTVFSIPVGIVYRPNEAKVKNLKAKDYLGKARLVAATDRNQAFTGFSGPEIKKMNAPVDKDDRPQEAISYAATNLVKPDVRSRNRQTSEPPPPSNARLQYPPTPPPESDKPDPEKTKALSRAESVRAGPKPKPLDLTIAGFDRRSSSNSNANPANPAPAAAATAQQAALRPRRAESERPAMRSQSVRQPNSSSSPSSMQRRNTERRRIVEPSADAGYDELYNLYGRPQASTTSLSTTRSSRHDGAASRQQQMYIEEENEFDDDEYNASYDEADFEMLSSNASTSALPTRMGTRRQPPAPAMLKIRVKVHAEDTRYVMITPQSMNTSHSSSSTYHSTTSLGSNSSMDATTVAFNEFMDAIRSKFGLRGSFKVKIKDDADMITLADQDDLDMAVETARAGARKERSEMGKMEVWIQAV